MEDRQHHWRAAVAAAMAAMASATLLAFAESSVAHEGEAHPALTPREAELAIGESADQGRDGLFRVRAGGQTLLTHGPDPTPPADRIATRVAGGVFGPSGDERAPACATDYYQHVLVGRLAGAPDRTAEVRASVQAAIRRMNWVLNADSIESGGVTADYKVLCDPRGEIQVDSFASPSAQFEDVVRSARAAGFDEENADYTIFFDGLGPGGGCGIGSYRADDRLSAANVSNTGGGYGIAYQPCWYGATPMHENAHNQGAVTYAAPQSTGSGGHCNQGHDVLCYTPDGGDRNQTPLNIACADRPHFDCGGEDYFDSAPEPGEYLASHWNLGSPLNRFIAFGRGDAGDPQPQPQGDPACLEVACAVRLRIGAAIHGAAVGANRPAVYRIKVPRARRSLTVDIDGMAPVELYLRHGEFPERDDYDCRSADGGTSQSCRIAKPVRGNWYVAVTSPEGTGETPFAIQTRAALAP